ncbi:MAG: diaminopimelate decarboxylase [Bacteroidota bacterium]|jgi:diaminopimelate decarboxylase
MFNTGITEKFRQIRTPFYYYDLGLLNATISRCLQEADRHGFHLHYALKANSNARILDLISSNGLGADCVSGNEVSMALAHGFPADRIVFAGVGKTDDELRLALGSGIQSINVESLQEMEVIQELASDMDKKARISLRIIPNVDAHTHRYITTGLEENKFGILPWQFDAVLDRLRSLDRLELQGLHFHIGSQITDLDVFKSLCDRVNEINSWFTEQGFTADIINVGGGLGVDYGEPDKCSIPDFESYFRIFSDLVELHGRQQLHFEPGRAIVAQCGSLISTVLFIKEAVNTSFAIIDAGMNDLIRPALYQSYHKIQNLSSTGKKRKYDVVGPVCESSDCFGKSVILCETKRGDLIAIRSTGAYGQTMASRYNLRDIAAEVYSDGI